MPLIVQPTTKKIILPVIFIILTVGLLSWALYITKDSTPAQAASRSDWIAGNIISDSNFTDKDSMSVAEIQSFLDSKIGNCDIWGTGRATEFGSNLTRAQYAASRGWAAPPYTCLNKYYEVPKTSPGGTLPANNYSNPTSIPTGAQSAAWIIKDAANRYNISPKVLLVKIATESAGPLTSDSWPLFSQYRYAMGSNCPDSGPGGSANCDPNYAGFSIQMYSAAQLMRWYLDSMEQPWWSYKKPYQNNSILWNVVERGCGSGNVFIENKATAALYTYTPYQPNNAALNNLYGTGDNCSAYGNRNVWRVYWDWFGSTRTQPKFEPFADPRRMTLSKNAAKVNPSTSLATGTVFPQGLTRKFVSKVLLSTGEWCFRTESDEISKSSFCFPQSSLNELSIQLQPISVDSSVFQVKSTAYKVDLRRNKKASQDIEYARQIFVTHAVTIEDTLYYISRSDDPSFEIGIPAEMLEKSYPFEQISPVRMQATQLTRKVNLGTLQQIDPELPQFLTRTFNSRAKINNTWYYRTEVDAEVNAGKAISQDHLTSDIIQPFVAPRCFSTTQVAPLLSADTGSSAGSSIGENEIYKYSYKHITDTDWYFQRDLDHKAGNTYIVQSDQLRGADCFEPFTLPRELTLSVNASKTDPSTGKKYTTFQKGLTRKYVSKVYSNGQWYYRTEVDDASNQNLAFPASALVEAR